MLDDNIKSIIIADIERCKQQETTRNGSQKLFESLIARYSTIYEGFKDEIIVSGKLAAGNQEFDYRPEVNSIKEKLEIILVTGVLKEKAMSNLSINNSNTNYVTISVSFEDVKKQVEDMSALSTVETEEILQKIDELKNIVSSNESKKSKWEKAKPFLTWLADKSVDVGIALLPRILKKQ